MTKYATVRDRRYKEAGSNSAVAAVSDRRTLSNL
jgi:hypothetical protein